MIKKIVVYFPVMMSLLFTANAFAEDLLMAELVLQNGQHALFTLSGESTEKIVDGEIMLGERVFTITKQSRLGLIGARRMLTENDAKAAEYALLSSSFSSQTGVGQPWVSAAEYVNCDTPYNTFLAVYHVNDPAALAKLGPIPYPHLAEGKGAPDSAVVYCFYAKPPGKETQ